MVKKVNGNCELYLGDCERLNRIYTELKGE